MENVEYLNIISNIRQQYIFKINNSWDEEDNKILKKIKNQEISKEDLIDKIIFENLKYSYVLRWELYQLKSDDYPLYRIILETIYLDSLKLLLNLEKKEYIDNEEQKYLKELSEVTSFNEIEQIIFKQPISDEIGKLDNIKEVIEYLKVYFTSLKNKLYQTLGDNDKNTINYNDPLRRMIYYSTKAFELSMIDDYSFYKTTYVDKSEYNYRDFSYVALLETVFYNLKGLDLTYDGFLNYFKEAVEIDSILTENRCYEILEFIVNNDYDLTHKILLPFIKHYYVINKYLSKDNKQSISRANQRNMLLIETKDIETIIYYLKGNQKLLLKMIKTAYIYELYGVVSNGESVPSDELEKFTNDNIPKSLIKKLTFENNNFTKK